MGEDKSRTKSDSGETAAEEPGEDSGLIYHRRLETYIILHTNNVWRSSNRSSECLAVRRYLKQDLPKASLVLLEIKLYICAFARRRILVL